MYHWTRLATLLPLALLGTTDLADPILRRHDRDDARYLAAGERWGASVCTVGSAAGTVIGDRWVLTAAHVAGNISPFSRSVRCGTRSFAIAEVYTYPGWARKRDSGGDALDLEIPDLALVRLATPATGIPIVRLHRAGGEPGRRIIVVGNGLSGTGESGPETDDGRLRAATNVIDSVFGQYFTFTFSQPDDPAATDLEGIGGPGDSGGPALILRRGRLYVAGVSSLNHRGDAAGPSQYRSTELYARVSPNAAWIDGVMAGRGTPDAVTDAVRPLAATGWPATGPGVTARRWLEAFNSQDSVQIVDFERALRADSLLAKRSAEERVASSRTVFADWGPLQAWGYVESPGKPFMLLVRSDKLDRWMSLSFRLEETPPHKLAGLSVRHPEDAPADAVPRR
ncbi:MAG TPA: trypsin-like serine protease [Longimicrobium sp.]|nr:trypsin-like serine protease [Longimicrobium sp.]